MERENKMAFTHKNTINYKYTAGGVTTSKNVEVSETESGEINVDETITFTSTVDGTVEHDIVGFEFQTAANAVSHYFLLDGVNGTLKAYNSGTSTAVTMADLDDGVPYVWSKNGGTNFPAGATNKMVDNTVKLIVIPDAYHETNNPKHVADGTATITVRVLYDATGS